MVDLFHTKPVDYSDYDVEADLKRCAERFAEGRCAGCGGLFVVGLEDSLVEPRRVEVPDRFVPDGAGGDAKIKAYQPSPMYMCAWCIDDEVRSGDPDAYALWQYGRC